MKTNWLLFGLLALSVVLAALWFADPDQAQRAAEARRAVGFDVATQEILLLLGALAIGGYLVWDWLKRD